MAKTRAIKVLSYAMQGEEGSANCEKFVEVLGLKTFFPAFMGKVSHDRPSWVPTVQLTIAPGRGQEEEARRDIVL